MNHRVLHRIGLLAGLLLLSTLTLPLGHAVQHSEGGMPPSGPVVEAWCDFCHQPFVALAQEPPALVASRTVVPLVVRALPVPPATWAPLSQSRGPPAIL